MTTTNTTIQTTTGSSLSTATLTFDPNNPIHAAVKSKGHTEIDINVALAQLNDEGNVKAREQLRNDDVSKTSSLGIGVVVVGGISLSTLITMGASVPVILISLLFHGGSAATVVLQMLNTLAGKNDRQLAIDRLCDLAEASSLKRGTGISDDVVDEVPTLNGETADDIMRRIHGKSNRSTKHTIGFSDTPDDDDNDVIEVPAIAADTTEPVLPEAYTANPATPESLLDGLEAPVAPTLPTTSEASLPEANTAPTDHTDALAAMGLEPDSEADDLAEFGFDTTFDNAADLDLETRAEVFLAKAAEDGFPIGTLLHAPMVILWGESQSGKSTLAHLLSIVRLALSYKVAYFSTENDYPALRYEFADHSPELYGHWIGALTDLVVDSSKGDLEGAAFVFDEAYRYSTDNPGGCFNDLWVASQQFLSKVSGRIVFITQHDDHRALGLPEEQQRNYKRKIRIMAEEEYQGTHGNIAPSGRYYVEVPNQKPSEWQVPDWMGTDPVAWLMNLFPELCGPPNNSTADYLATVATVKHEEPTEDVVTEETELTVEPPTDDTANDTDSLAAIGVGPSLRPWVDAAIRLLQTRDDLYTSRGWFSKTKLRDYSGIKRSDDHTVDDVIDVLEQLTGDYEVRRTSNKRASVRYLHRD